MKKLAIFILCFAGFCINEEDVTHEQRTMKITTLIAENHIKPTQELILHINSALNLYALNPLNENELKTLSDLFGDATPPSPSLPNTPTSEPGSPGGIKPTTFDISQFIANELAANKEPRNVILQRFYLPTYLPANAQAIRYFTKHSYSAHLGLFMMWHFCINSRSKISNHFTTLDINFKEYIKIFIIDLLKNPHIQNKYKAKIFETNWFKNLLQKSTSFKTMLFMKTEYVIPKVFSNIFFLYQNSVQNDLIKLPFFAKRDNILIIQFLRRHSFKITQMLVGIDSPEMYATYEKIIPLQQHEKEIVESFKILFENNRAKAITLFTQNKPIFAKICQHPNYQKTRKIIIELVNSFELEDLSVYFGALKMESEPIEQKTLSLIRSDLICCVVNNEIGIANLES